MGQALLAHQSAEKGIRISGECQTTQPAGLQTAVARASIVALEGSVNSDSICATSAAGRPALSDNDSSDCFLVSPHAWIKGLVDMGR